MLFVRWIAAHGRLCLVLAAVLWSLSGLFTRLLQRETVLGLNTPTLTPIQITFYRALFGGLIFVPLLSRRDMTFRPLMPVMVACFAAMSAFFISAMALGSAANAILLQNVAPFWVYLIAVFILGNPPDRRSAQAIAIGLLGVGVIVGSGWYNEGMGKLSVTALALGSSVTYAAVILCLRALRRESSIWLVMQNHLGSAVCLAVAVLLLNGPAAFAEWLSVPTSRQLAFLAVFGVMQMALPYLLFAHGLRTVSPQEAGAITLLEPLLNPVWAYLISPETETPTWPTIVGGGLILIGLLWRYVGKASDPSSLAASTQPPSSDPPEAS